MLVVNAGSSSLKLSVIGPGDETLASAELSAPRAVVDDDELRAALGDRGLGEVDAVGHRIVHGGSRFRSAVVVDASVRRALGELVDLAPLHQPKSLASLDAVSRALPGVPAVACFDTAFHATLPDAAFTYALPADWSSRWGVRRYGFHGLSHAWIARRAPSLLGASVFFGLANRQLPPGGRGVVVRDRRRAVGRHDDGVHAARGVGDGHAFGQRRPGPRAVAALAWRRVRGRARPRARARVGAARAVGNGGHARGVGASRGRVRGRGGSVGAGRLSAPPTRVDRFDGGRAGRARRARVHRRRRRAQRRDPVQGCRGPFVSRSSCRSGAQ